MAETFHKTSGPRAELRNRDNDVRTLGSITATTPLSVLLTCNATPEDNVASIWVGIRSLILVRNKNNLEGVTQSAGRVAFACLPNLTEEISILSYFVV